jgi:hypothetical protein
MSSFEKLGAFYLGREVDPISFEVKAEDILYDAKDLTTHAVCVGMTGSGKTGLCLSLIEEAAIDGIPVLAIDPKGDLGNLCLTFPDLKAASFEPWVDPGEALRKGMDVPSYAKKTADLWKSGLAKWGQNGARIQRFRKAVDLTIFTPGSSAGIPLTVLKSFAAPKGNLASDPEALGERVQTAVTGLLSLLGRDGDPLTSNEHILLSQLVSHAWKEGRDLSLGDLIRGIQEPPFEKVGFFDLESFFPQKERRSFAMAINNLLISPSFAPWMEGEPLDIQNLLWTQEGKPRVSILSIAHLSEEQRMFFVTLFLGELLAWARTQPGTSSLRALFYMDEVFGYFPPTANPPSKRPMLTLLKQARAYGLGCVLSTQNPVDLDYKGLSNTGTWFLGRLQTERDKMRVLEGLEGVAASAGTSFDRASMETLLAGLDSRVFLMNNVHEDRPVLFHSRWALSYLRGPLTREQIKVLMRDKKKSAKMMRRGERGIARKAATGPNHCPPILPKEIHQGILPPQRPVPPGVQVVLQPGLMSRAKLHFVAAREGVDEWKELTCLALLFDEGLHNPWEEGESLPGAPLRPLPVSQEEGSFAPLPPAASKKTSYRSWGARLKEHLYRTQAIQIWKCRELRQSSKPGETESEFRSRLSLLLRERRDLALEKLRKRFGTRLQRLQDRIRTAEERVSREQAQYKQQKVSTMLSVGSTLLGALFGRKVASVGNVRRAASAARGASRAAREKGDIARAQSRLQELQSQLRDLEDEFEDEREKKFDSFDVDSLDIQCKDLAPRKSDIDAGQIQLVWLPFADGPTGREALYL